MDQSSSNKTVIEILKSARNILSDESKWTTGLYAKNSNGKSVSPGSEHAVCFCSVGACAKVVFDMGFFDFEKFQWMMDDRYKSEFQILENVISELNKTTLSQKFSPIELFNDSASHKEVLGAFDKTIHRLQSETPV